MPASYKNRLQDFIARWYRQRDNLELGLRRDGQFLVCERPACTCGKCGNVNKPETRVLCDKYQWARPNEVIWSIDEADRYASSEMFVRCQV